MMEITDWTHWHDEKELRENSLIDISSEVDDEHLLTEVYKTVIDELREYGYHFTGDYHQNGEFGVPVIDEKYVMQLSQRSWGQLMADAYPEEDYSQYEEQALSQNKDKDYYHYIKWAWIMPQGATQYTPEEDPWEDFDWCYECTGYGDDYSVNDNGELVSNCENCPHNKCEQKED